MLEVVLQQPVQPRHLLPLALVLLPESLDLYYVLLRKLKQRRYTFADGHCPELLDSLFAFGAFLASLLLQRGPGPNQGLDFSCAVGLFQLLLRSRLRLTYIAIQGVVDRGELALQGDHGRMQFRCILLVLLRGSRQELVKLLNACEQLGSFCG